MSKSQKINTSNHVVREMCIISVKLKTCITLYIVLKIVPIRRNRKFGKINKQEV